MASDTTGSGVLARRYASALLDLAEKAAVVDIIEKEIGFFEGLLSQHKDLRTVLTSPLFSREIQASVALAVAKKAGLSDLAARFLNVLAKNRRIDAFTEISAAFRRSLSERKGEVRARVETAFALNSEQVGSIKAMIGRTLGARDIVLDIEINRELLGGIVLTVGSRRIDASLAGRLGRLGRDMMAGAADPRKVA